MNIKQNKFESICKEFYKLGYWDAEEIDNATRHGDSEQEFDIMFNDNKHRVLDYIQSNSCYIIPKELLDEILSQAIVERNNWEFPNEMFIEADTCVEVVEYIVQHSELI